MLCWSARISSLQAHDGCMVGCGVIAGAVVGTGVGTVVGIGVGAGFDAGFIMEYQRWFAITAWPNLFGCTPSEQ